MTRSHRAPRRGQNTALIIEDHPIYRAGLRRALEVAGIEVLGEACSEAEAWALLPEHAPIVCLVDLRLGAEDGVRLIEGLGRSHPKVRCIALSAFDDPHNRARAERAGAIAFLSKEIDAAGLVAAVRDASARTLPTTARLTSEAAPRGVELSLSPRQQTVLERLSAGRTVREISAELQINARTVQTYRATLKRKLGVHSTEEIRALGRSQGLLEP